MVVQENMELSFAAVCFMQNETLNLYYFVVLILGTSGNERVTFLNSTQFPC